MLENTRCTRLVVGCVLGCAITPKTSATSVGVSTTAGAPTATTAATLTAKDDPSRQPNNPRPQLQRTPIPIAHPTPYNPETAQPANRLLNGQS